MYQNISFSVRSTSRISIKICSEKLASCNDVYLDIDSFSNQWKYFSIRAEDSKLIIKDFSKDYEAAFAYNPEHQELPKPNVLKKQYRNYGISISNLNFTRKEDDNVFVLSVSVPEGVMKLYECMYKILVLLICFDVLLFCCFAFYLISFCFYFLR